MHTCAQTQEMWSAMMPAWAIVSHCRAGNSLSMRQVLLSSMFLAHYVWRSFVYPLLLRGGKPTPAGIWLLASSFCMYNGYMQASSILKEQGQHLQTRHVLGAALWLVGWGVNLHSDYILRKLRKPGETGDHGPHGHSWDIQ